MGNSSFLYGPDTARVAKLSTVGTTVYFGADLELDPSGTWTKYIHQDVIRRGNGINATNDWLHRDHLKNIRLITNAGGPQDERAILRFRNMKSSQKFAFLHASIYNHFNLESHLTLRDHFKQNRNAALSAWRQLSAI